MLVLKDLTVHTTLIHSLSMSCCPSAIRRFVIAVGVNAVKGISSRAQSHVGKERLEAVKPALTDANASAAVAFEVFAARAIAPFAHIAPCFEFRRRRHSVRNRTRFQLFNAQATTGICAHEIIALHQRFFAAVAETPVFRMLRAALTGASFNDDQPSESLTFCDFRHGMTMPYFALYRKGNA